MLKAARMLRADIIILEKDLKKVTEGLGRLGVMQFIEASRQDETHLLEHPERHRELLECDELKERLRSLIRQLGIIAEPSREVGYASMDLSAIAGEVANIETEVNEASGGNGKIDEELQKIKKLVSDIEIFEGLDIPLEEVENLSFLHFAVGSFPASSVAELSKEVGEDVVIVPYRDSEDNDKLLSMTKKKGRWALESSLNRYGFKSEKISENYKGTPADVLMIARERLKELQIAQKIQQAKLSALKTRYEDKLVIFLRRIDVEKMILEAQEHFSRSWATFFIAGWVPRDKVDVLCKEISRLTHNRAVINIFTPRESEMPPGETPILMQHGKWLRPFEILVNNYDTPGYNEVEPTLFVAFTFLLMFGIMFGDIGHGAVLFLLGLLMKLKAANTKLRDGGVVVAAAGVSSMIFGVLFGSVFAYTFTPLWIEPLRSQDIITILMFTIGIGILMISTGIIVNIVNSFASKDYLQGIFGKFGIVGILFYWGALGIGIKLAYSEPDAMTKWAIVFLIVVPFLVLLLREPIRYLLLPKEKKEFGGIFIAVAEGAIDILEAFTAFLANTMSFVRVGAFALSHAALCLVIFSVMDVVKDMPGGTALSIIVLIVGNAFVIAFEGLIVTIQSIRLEYYEFFSKFFRGGGKLYKPFVTK